ncbi:MAG TPA: FhaA domain-containing protein [Candidatus Limnocylindrales bacterium]|nr:FhaA domain-containing protein [Candidatus Limnocylindrales bacterium]
MRPLASLERFFERLFEGQSARLFHTKLQPIQLQRRVERAMESGRVRDGDRTVVPHRFAVHVAAEDLAALRDAHPTLAADLADAALEFARSHHYRLADRPNVALVADTAIEPGDILVATGSEPEHTDDAAVESPHADPPPADQTAVFTIPTVDAPKARLREIRPDGSTRTFNVDGRPLTIGRAPDNGLVLFDGRVSRHHARLYGRRGALLLADLGSTNGSWVNDRKVEEMALGEGDRIRVGDTILVVETFEDG